VFDFFKRMFGPEPSSTMAKERLRLVLLSDHLSLSPDIVDAMKADLLAVIRRYVEIDESHAEVNFEHRDRDIAMLASVPILSVRPTPLPAVSPPRPLPSLEPVVSAAPVAVAPAPPVEEEVNVESEPQPVAVVDSDATKSAAPRRRRRRRPKTITSDARPVLPQAQPAQA
jgi:cell division topological specificity factor